MKFFLLALCWLLLFENLQGSTLSRERSVRALNTTLRTNFSGTYERKNPCSGAEVETSSYKASQEFHHHAKDDGWSDYTHKCSALIRNFLQTIGNLIRFNQEPNGSFNFYLNTSISQKQRVSANHKSCESLPTIVIEATDCKIPLDPPRTQIPKDKTIKKNLTDDPKCRTQTKDPNEQPPPSTDFPLQCTTPKCTTQDPASDWFEPGFSHDGVSVLSQSTPEFPTAFAPAGQPPQDLYDLSRDAHSTYEPVTKYFKTSLRLTPQTDPENGTIQPRIHYMAANLVTDPTRTEPAVQSQAENPLPNPGTLSEAQSTMAPPPECTPSSSDGPAVRSSTDQNDQLSVVATPKPRFPFPSPTEGLPETTAAPTEERFPFTTESPLQTDQTPDSVSKAFTPRERQINDPGFPSPAVKLQPATAANYQRQTSPVALPLDVPSGSTPPSSSSVVWNQSQDSLFPPLKEELPQDLPLQTGGSIPGAAMSDAFPRRPPTADDASLNAAAETLVFSDRTPRNQLNTPPFGTQEIPPSYQPFMAPPPYVTRLPSTNQPPNYSNPTEGSKEMKDVSMGIGTRPVAPFLPAMPVVAAAGGPPDRDSLIAPPVNPDLNTANTFSGQQPIPDGRFRPSSTVTIVEETVTYNEKQSTPRMDAVTGQIPESMSNRFDPSLPSGPEFPIYEVPQQSPPELGPILNSSIGHDGRFQPISSQKSPEKEKPAVGDIRPESPLANLEFTPINTQAIDYNNRVQPVPMLTGDRQTDETPSGYITTPMPALYPAAPETEPPSATPVASYSGLTTYPPRDPNFQPTYQQSFSTPPLPDEPVNEPLEGHLDRIGLRGPPVADAFLRGDYPTTAAPQPFGRNVDSFRPFTGRPNGGSTSDNSVTSDSVFVSQSEQESSSINPDSSLPATSAPNQFWPATDSERIADSVSPGLSPPVTPPPQVYPLQPRQQQFTSTSIERVQQQSFIDRIPRLPPKLPLPGLSSAVLSQGQLDNRRASPPDVVIGPTISYMEQNFQTPSHPAETDSQQTSETEILDSKSRNPQNLVGSSEQITDIVAFPLSSDSLADDSDSSERFLTTFSPPNSPSQFTDATAPFNDPPVAEDPNPKSVIDRPSAATDNVATALPAEEEESSRSLNFSDDLSSVNSQQLKPVLPAAAPQPLLSFSSPQPGPVSSDYPSASQIQSFDEFAPTTAQPLDFIPPTSIPPQTLNKVELPELLIDYNHPVAFETQPLLTTPAVEIVPTAAEQPPMSRLQQAEETVTTFAPKSFGYNPVGSKLPQGFDGTLTGASQDVNESGPPAAFNPQSAENAAGQREPAVFSRGDYVATDSSTQPVLQKGRVSYRTPVTEETSTSTDSTGEPLLEPFRVLPEPQVFPNTPPRSQSITVEEVTTTRRQFQPPNLRQSSDEPTDAFVPSFPQQIQTPSVRSVPPQQEVPPSGLDPTLPLPVVAPQTPLNYPDQLSSSYSNRQNLQSAVLDSEFRSPQEKPQGEINPVFPFITNHSQIAALRTPPLGNYQQRGQQLPQPRTQPEFLSEPTPNSYNGDLPTPPRAPSLDRNSLQHLNYPPNFPKSRSPFLPQQPMPQINSSQLLQFPPSNFPPTQQLVPQQVPDPSPMAAPQIQPLGPDGRLLTSADRLPAAVPPAYLQIPGPNVLLPPLYPRQIPNDFRPQGLYDGPPRPLNNDPRLQPPNFPLPAAAPSPDIPPRDRFPDDRQIIRPRENYPVLRPNLDTHPGREVQLLTDGQEFRQQTEEGPALNVQPGFPTPPQTSSRPLELPIRRPPPAQENPLPNPILQQQQPRLIIPMQEYPHHRTSFPGRYDQNQPPSFDRQNDGRIDTSHVPPPLLGQWNPQLATNLVNLQQNADVVGVPNRLPSDPRPLVPDQTAPSNEPEPASTATSDHVGSPLRNSFYADRMSSGSGPERF